MQDAYDTILETKRFYSAFRQQDPEAELILHKAKKVHVKSEPEADF